MSTCDLLIVLKTLREIRAKWHNFGLELRISPDDLEAIKIRSNDPEECFKEMLSIWLKRENPKPTWSTLVNALRSPMVGYEQLAETVRLEHNISEVHECSDTFRPEVLLASNTGSVPIKDESTLFQCPCGNCDLISYVEKGCPKTSCQCYPYLPLDQLSRDDKEDLIQKLSDDTANIIQTFADLLSSTAKSLKERNTTVKELVRVALELGMYKSERNQVPLLAEDRSELVNANSIDDAFITLGKHMSFFNYEILGHIIRQLGNDNDYKQLEEFCTTFKVFCQRKVFEVSPSVFDPSGR